jgi:hypothetical protein
MSQDASAAAQDLPELRERMAAIKEGVAAEVEARWVTPYRTPAVFDTKVSSRLASHKEYRSLQDRVREGEAALAAESSSAGTEG